MRLSELAQAAGVTENVVNHMCRSGKLQSEIIPDSTVPIGHYREVTTPLEEALEIIQTRKVRTVRPRRVGPKSIANLPPNKDLFLVPEVVKILNITDSTFYNWVKTEGLAPMKNGRIAYYSRPDVEKLIKKREASLLKSATPQGAAPEVTAPRVVAAQSDAAIRRVEQQLVALALFVKEFAESCGFKK